MKAIIKIYSNNEESKTLYFGSKKDALEYERKFLSGIQISERVKKGIETRVESLKSQVFSNDNWSSPLK